jgi:integrase
MVLGMKRSELEGLGGPDVRWIIPGGFEGRTKSHAVHVVPLSPQAERLVRSRMDMVTTEALFSPTRKASSDVMTWSSRFVDSMKRAAEKRARAPLPRWTVHNIRHTVGTHLREDLKVPRDVVSLILGHTPPGPAASRIYDRSQMLTERRDALTRWATWIDELSRRGEVLSGNRRKATSCN